MPKEELKPVNCRCGEEADIEENKIGRVFVACHKYWSIYNEC